MPEIQCEQTRSASPELPLPADGGVRFPWFWFVLTVCLAKIAVLIADFHPALFLGDSLSYLETARTGWIPPDRSFTYGFSIRMATAFSHSLHGLLIFQTIAGLATAMLAVIMLVRHLRVCPRLAFIAGVLLAIEPSQLMFERMVMAESLGTLCFMAMLACGMEAVSRGNRRAIVAAAVCGVAAISYRTSLIPAVVVCEMALPLLVLMGDRAYRPASRSFHWLRRGTVYAICSAGCFACLLGGYAVLYGRLLHLPPSLNHYDGFISLAAVSHSASPADTDDPRVAEVLASPRLRGGPLSRNAELFAPEGLIPRLTRLYGGDAYRANVVAKQIARRVLMRDPMLVVRSACDIYGGFLSPRFMGRELMSETGYDRAVSESPPAGLGDWGVKPEDVTQLTVVRRLYHSSYLWFLVALHAPILLCWGMVLLNRGARPLMLLAAVAATGLTATVLALAIQPVARYLHPLTPILTIAVAFGANAWVDAVRRQRSSQNQTTKSASEAGPSSPSDKRFPWFAFLTAIIFTKLATLALDFHIFPFMGDSMSYLETARTGWIPPDRSFTYGFAIRLATAFSHSLYGLLLLQTLAGIGTASLTVLMLVRHIRVSRTTAFVIGLLLAVEPSQLMFERMIMAESIGTLFFTAMLACSLEAIVRGSRWAMVAAAALGVAAISFRSALFPAVLVDLLLLTPIVLTADSRFRGDSFRTSRLRRATICAACSFGCFVCLLGGYAFLYGRLIHYPPALNYYDGLIPLVSISPWVKPADTDDPRIAEVLSRPRVGGDGPRGRNAELWLPQGLVSRLVAACGGDYYEANVAAKAVVWRTLWRDPLALARAGGETYRGFLADSFMERELRSETGYGRAISNERSVVLASFGLPSRDLGTQLPPVRSLYHASYQWFLVLLHATVLLPWVIMLLRRPVRPLLLLPAVTAMMVVLSSLVLAPEPVARYLHPLTPIFAISLAVLLSLCVKMVAGRRSDVQ